MDLITLIAIWEGNCPDGRVAFPLTASCLLPLPDGVYEKVARYLGLGRDFRWVLQFPPPATTG